MGDLELTYEMMELSADPSLSIVTYNAEPAGTSEEALGLLGSWAATLDQEERARSTVEEARRVTEFGRRHIRLSRLVIVGSVIYRRLGDS